VSDQSFHRTRATFRLLYDSAQTWIDERALRLGAGVAYYALFALVPVMFLSIAFASFFLGQAVRGDVENALAGLLGEDFANALISAIDAIELGGSNTVFSLISFGLLIFTATLLFVAWKEVVDLLWGIPRERGARASVMRRLFGLAAVLGSGALLTLNLAVETIIAAVDSFVDNQLFDLLLKITGSFIPVMLGAIFIGVLFRFTPDIDISWRYVWFAALVSMVMLAVGAWGYGVYLDTYAFSSAAGAAGALLLGLVLVYYGTAILLYGMTIVKLAHSSDTFVPLAFKLGRSDGT
jgi:membrane protein